MNRKYLLEFCKMMFVHCMWVWYGLYDTVLDSTFKKLRSWYPVPSLCGKLKTGADFIFLGSKITKDSDYTHKVRRLLLLGRKAMTNLDSILKSRDIFAYKGLHSQSYGFSSSCVEVWELDHKEGWMLKNWCFQTVVLEKTLESPLDCKEIKPVNPKGNQYWIFIGKTDTEAPILWPPDAKSWLIEKDPDAGENWGQEEKVVTEDQMVGWHYWFNGHEFEQTTGDSDGQGSLVCWVHQVTKGWTWLSDWTATINILLWSNKGPKVRPHSESIPFLQMYLLASATHQVSCILFN